MLTVKAFSETALFRVWSDQDFDSLSVRKYISKHHHHFSQCLKIDVNSRHGTKT